jgi:RHS repeat-associated protein
VKTPQDLDANGTVDAYRVCLQNVTDYSPFGVTLDGRTIESDFYRRGFNGMEKDDEVKSSGNSYDFGARMYDSRVGRMLSIDPHISAYPNFSSYVFAINNPIIAIDPDGKDVHIVIGENPVSTANIRLIGSEKVKGAPKTVEVKLYKMTVTDDVTGKTSVYFVTRDAPIINQTSPVGVQIIPSWLGGKEIYNVTNTSFEPRGDNKYNLVPTSTAGEGAYALRTITGDTDLPAEPNNSPFRKKANFATDIMIHIGGVYKAPDGSKSITGSEGCFTLQGKDAGNKGIQNLVKDINERKAANKKAGKGTNIDLVVKKRVNVKKEWRVYNDGKEGY